MKNYKKKIRNTILYTALGRGLIIGGIIALIIIIGEAALRIPGARYAGWDITYTDEDRWILIEGNGIPMYEGQTSREFRKRKEILVAEYILSAPFLAVFTAQSIVHVPWIPLATRSRHTV